MLTSCPRHSDRTVDGLDCASDCRLIRAIADLWAPRRADGLTSSVIRMGDSQWDVFQRWLQSKAFVRARRDCEVVRSLLDMRHEHVESPDYLEIT